MNKYAKLLAYVEEYGGDWVADWDDVNQNKYYVYFDIVDKEYRCAADDFYLDICKVYMSRDCGEGLADKLNSGEVIF